MPSTSSSVVTSLTPVRPPDPPSRHRQAQNALASPPPRLANAAPEAEFDTPAPAVHNELDALLQLGVEKGTIKKLTDANIRTIERVLMEPLKNLIAINGLSEAKAKKVIEQAKAFKGGAKFSTASDILAKQRTEQV